MENMKESVDLTSEEIGNADDFNLLIIQKRDE